MKKRIRVKRYQTGGNLNYLNSDPQFTNQIQPLIQQQQQAGQYGTQPGQFNQYMNKAGKFGGALGTGYYASQQPSNLPSAQGEQGYNTAMAGVSQAGPIGGVIGGVSAIGDAIGKPIRAHAERTDENTGGYANIGQARRTAVVGAMFNPFKALMEHPNYKKLDQKMKYNKQVGDWSNSLNTRGSQPQYNYNPTFAAGGDYPGVPMRMYQAGGELVAPRDEMRTAGSYGRVARYINSIGNINDPRLYQSPDSIGQYMTVLLRPKLEDRDKDKGYVNTLSQAYVNNWNKKFGKQLGYFHDPNRPSVGIGFEKDSPEYKKLLIQYENENKKLKPSGVRAIGDSASAGIGTSQYPYGGYHTNYGGNAELEDDEIFRTPDGDMEKVNGRSHAQGGENYNLPQNTEILGKNKAPNGKSYKENGDRLMRQFNKYTKILEDKPTALAKNTANLMLKKVHENYTDLMNQQEMEKYYMTPEEEMEYACGGIVPQFKGGGWIKKAAASIKRRGTKGKCTPITKPGCTGRAKALAKTFKKIARNRKKHDDGGLINETGYLQGYPSDNNPMNIIPSNYITTNGMSRPISAMSDTGDYQNLYPNTGNYAFGGNYVMEKPLMAQGGYTDYEYRPLVYQDGGDVYLNKQPKYRGFISQQDANTAKDFFGNDVNDIMETRQGTPGMLQPRGIGPSGMPNPIQGTIGKYQLSGSQQPQYGPGQEHTRFIDQAPDKWYNQAIDTAGQYAPIAYNMYQGLFGKPEHMNPQDYYNPYENQVMSLMRSRRYNVEPELEANRLAAADYYQNLRQGAPSQGRYLAGLQAGQTGRQRADAEAYARKQNIDNQYIGEEASTLGGFGSQRAGMNFQVADINAANRAAQRRYLPTALSQLQQQTQMNKIMREKKRLAMNQALTDEERQRLYMEAFKGYNFAKRINPITGEEI